MRLGYAFEKEVVKLFTAQQGFGSRYGYPLGCPELVCWGSSGPLVPVQFMAMSRYRLNQPVEACSALTKASELAAAKLPNLKSGDFASERWHDDLIAYLLLHEAQALIGEK